MSAVKIMEGHAEINSRKNNQKTREGCGCFRGLFGSVGGKFWENCWNMFPESLQFLGFWAPGKANLPGTVGRHCLDLVCTFCAACFLKSTVPTFWPQLAHYSYGCSSLEKQHFWVQGWQNPWKTALLGAERTKSLEKTALLGAERNGLFRLQLQFQLQCCNSPELVTWL